MNKLTQIIKEEIEKMVQESGPNDIAPLRQELGKILYRLSAMESFGQIDPAKLEVIKKATQLIYDANQLLRKL